MRVRMRMKMQWMRSRTRMLLDDGGEQIHLRNNGPLAQQRGLAVRGTGEKVPGDL